MTYNDNLTRERIRFLSQDADALRSMKGQALYDTLQGLGLSHSQYFRALGTNVQDYCAQEFGVDLGRVTVERFFQSDPQAKWLFPDIVRESVLMGMKRKPVYPELIVRDESVPGTAYDVPYVEDAPEEEELRAVAEGSVIPESSISYGNRVVRLEKKGRGVVASYEVIRRMSVDLLRVHLQRMGERLGRDLDTRLATVLAEGDGSDGSTAPVVIDTATPETWAYGDLMGGYMTLAQDHYFTPTHMLVEATAGLDILNLPEFKDSNLFDFARSGKLPSPFGVQIVPMAGQPEGKVTILDAGYAVQKLTEQDLLVESDKLINQQWDRSYLTVVTDFAILYEKARMVVNSDWSE